MKLSFIFLFFCLCLFGGEIGSQKAGKTRNQKTSAVNSVMSEAYWKLWNPEVQAKIDRDIDKYRKADAVCILKDVSPGTTVTVEQLSHDFKFGAHIFNYNQLGTRERNKRYKDLYGTLFNSATIAFYWKKFEMQPNRPRFREEYWDTEEYWNKSSEPKNEPHWRRPSTDQVVEFCESKGIRLHGHTIIWGNQRWSYPDWMFEQFCPPDEKEKLTKLSKEDIASMTPAQIGELAPVYFKEMEKLFDKRITEIAEYYKGRLHSWDVVNESATDFKGNSITGDPMTKSSYGFMPGDYIYKAFVTANKVFPENVLLNINDYANNENYKNQVTDLLSKGCRIDIMGSQMHLFDPQQCLDIAAGKPVESPQQVWDKMEIISKANLPIHLSEITITAPGDNEQGREIQAVITRNLYRIWFSIEKMMGITWWNVVDDCGAPGEPTTSGLFTRNMEPKPSYYALDMLINHEWKTKMNVKTDNAGILKFRGFRGLYRVMWKDETGQSHELEFYLKNDGDGLKM
jgi:GH35 family endo-1,4-beta-xylanase